MIKFINLWSCSDTFSVKLLCLKFKLTGGVQLFSSVSIVACSVFSSCKQIVWLLQFYSLHTLVEIHCLLQIHSPTRRSSVGNLPTALNYVIPRWGKSELDGGLNGEVTLKPGFFFFSILTVDNNKKFNYVEI